MFDTVRTVFEVLVTVVYLVVVFFWLIRGIEISERLAVKWECPERVGMIIWFVVLTFIGMTYTLPG